MTDKHIATLQEREGKEQLQFDRSLIGEVPSSMGASPSSTAVHEELQKVIDGVPEQVAVLDSQWTIVAVNKAWSRAASEPGLQSLTLRCNYIDHVVQRVLKGNRTAAAVLLALGEMNESKRTSFNLVYSAEGPREGHDYSMSISRFNSHGEDFATVTWTDVTELQMLRRQSHELKSRLLHSQEDERRRIARELHDSTSQLLVALQLGLMRLKQVPGGAESASTFHDLEETLSHVHQEIRCLASSADPRPVGAEGLVPALAAMVEEFVKRAHIDVEFIHDLKAEADPAAECAIYRIAQEALANVHRHARATKAQLKLIGRAKYLHIMIKDNGVGFDPGQCAAPGPIGVGIPGMKDRLRELGGHLSIRRLACGTAVIGTVPRRDAGASFHQLGASTQYPQSVKRTFPSCA